MFDHISKQLEFYQKYPAKRRILNTILGVSNVVKHGLFVFDIFYPVKVELVLRFLLR